MRDDDCIRFLQEVLPELGYRWKGFRKVRKQVCKRIQQRFRELNLSDLSSYRQHLDIHKQEEKILDFLCNITISRFYRDKGVFDRMKTEILPLLAETTAQNHLKHLRCWSVGCCSGEEAFTLQIIWKLSVLPQVLLDIPLQITATDRDASLIERAKKGIYPMGSLKDMPPEWKALAFVSKERTYHIKEVYQKDVQFLEQDIRKDLPKGEFELILCRNLVFTYFEDDLQQETFTRMMTKLKPGGFLVVGIHESIPEGQDILIPFEKCIYRKKNY
jgi:chemotaxis protein methyltransferase CheR